MQFYGFRGRPADNGTYVLADDRGDALVIDPAQNEAHVREILEAHKLRVVEILNTHGHGDHIHDNAALQKATGARIAIHRLDAYRLAGNVPTLSGFKFPPSEADDLIDEGPLGFVRDLALIALHTPGHTEGSTCFYLPDASIVFSGDVLFQGNVGRVDTPGGDARAMERSLARVAELPEDTKVFPGHGPSTTIGAEISWLRGFRFTDR